MSELIVQKYGGMCLETPEKILATAKTIANLHRQGKKLVIAVSAMGKSTDQLVNLAYQISSKPNRRELDMLLTTGERVSMALLCMALSDQGVPSVSLTGSQAGVLTDSSHSNAKIIDVRPIRVKEELSKNKVIVLAGFQGVDPVTKDITTLGRGGTDTTAVAMAAALSANRCEIIKEVEGLCSADPKIVRDARSYPDITHESLAEMCFWGAKILHYRSVELAMTMKVPLFICYANDEKKGTRILKEVPMFENQKVLSINSHQTVHHFAIDNLNEMNDGWVQFTNLLKSANLSWPQLLAASFEAGGLRAMYTSDSEHLSAISREIEKNSNIRAHKGNLSSVTLTCHASVATDLPAKAVAALAAHQIAVEKFVQTPLSLSLLVAPELREKAIQVLHSKFI